MENKKLTYGDIVNMQSTVLDWNRTFSNDVGNKDLVETYVHLTKEESNELFKAIKEGDLEEQLDAICDIMYTGSFWWCLEGNTLNESEAWFIKEIWNKKEYSYEDLVQSMTNSVEEKDSYDFQTNLLHLLAVANEKFDVLGAFEKVTKSNFSKCCLKKDVDIQSEIDYIVSQGRYDDIEAEENGDYVIFKAGKDLKENVTYKNKKVIKSRSFVSVKDLGGMTEFIRGE